MKDYKTEVDNDFVNELCQLADKENIDYEVYEGVLQDNYVFYNAENVETHKYIIIREFCKNVWNSGLEMIMTNSQELVDKYCHAFSAS